MGAIEAGGGEAEAVTDLLLAWNDGDPRAFDRLLPLLYGELKRLAAWQLSAQGPGHTLQPTALVHEAFLRLVDRQRVSWRGRAHFLAAAAQAMRHVLVDHARARGTGKRGGGRTRVSLATAEAEAPEWNVELLAIDLALDKLARLNVEKARVVELRYFGGLTIEETADVVGVSPATVKRSWAFAKAWLAREVGGIGHAL